MFQRLQPGVLLPHRHAPGVRHDGLELGAKHVGDVLLWPEEDAARLAARAAPRGPGLGPEAGGGLVVGRIHPDYRGVVSLKISAFRSGSDQREIYVES